MKDATPEWMGLKQVTHYANLSERTVRSWIHERVDPLPAVRVRGKILVRRSELDAWLEHFRKETLLGRLATVEDVANAVEFLASDRASCITGEVIHVCAGSQLAPR